MSAGYPLPYSTQYPGTLPVGGQAHKFQQDLDCPVSPVLLGGDN